MGSSHELWTSNTNLSSTHIGIILQAYNTYSRIVFVCVDAFQQASEIKAAAKIFLNSDIDVAFFFLSIFNVTYIQF